MNYNNYSTGTELKSELRDLKLKVISNEYKFEINKDSIKQLSNELNFIKSTLPDEIISGSIVLRLYGLIKRDINDIDILLRDKNLYSSYNKRGYCDDENEILNRLGFKTFNYKSWFLSKKRSFKVDFFENPDAPFDLVNIGGVKLKIHNPMEVINYKLQLCSASSGAKHNLDLTGIFRYMNMLDYANKHSAPDLENK